MIGRFDVDPRHLLLLASLALAPGCLMEVEVGTRQLPGDDDDDDDVTAPEDRDEDGFSPSQGDCDDFDPEIGPAGPFSESCDGVDNDCSSGVDVDPRGVHVCAANSRFVQTLTLDLLLVVDRSPTGLEMRRKASDAASDLLIPLIGPALDTHVGLVSMDLESPTAQGRLFELAGRRWVDGQIDAPLVAERFLTVGLTEVPDQLEGLEGGRTSLDAAMIEHADGWNAGFSRNTVPLVVVFLSDDEDPSFAPGVVELLDRLDDLRGISHLTMHAVVQNSPLGCDLQPLPDSEGQSYLDLAAYTNGFHLSHCEKDYGPFFSAIGQYAALEGLRTRFALEHAAQAPSVQVTLRLPDGGGERRLDPSEYGLTDNDHTVVLLMEPPPPAGTEILVDYERQF